LIAGAVNWMQKDWIRIVQSEIEFSKKVYCIVGNVMIILVKNSINVKA